MHVVFVKESIHPSWEALITGLEVEKVTVCTKYSDFADIFSLDFAAKLLEYAGINDHFIDSDKGKQPLYRPMYSLGQVQLQTLKTYIELNLASGFIRLLKSIAGAPILFIRKKNRSFRLCVDYWVLNNLRINNCYPLSLIEKSLNQLSWAKRFTQLDLIKAYHWMGIWEENK